jgi:hypothetical protein
MKVFEGADDLSDVKDEGFSRVLNGVHVSNLGQKLTALEQLHQEVKVQIILEGVLKFDYKV